MRDLFTLKEFCEEFGIGPSTFYRWEEKGIVHPIRIGGRCLRIKAAEVERLKKEGSHGDEK